MIQWCSLCWLTKSCCLGPWHLALGTITVEVGIPRLGWHFGVPASRRWRRCGAGDGMPPIHTSQHHSPRRRLRRLRHSLYTSAIQIHDPSLFPHRLPGNGCSSALARTVCGRSSRGLPGLAHYPGSRKTRSGPVRCRGPHHRGAQRGFSMSAVCHHVGFVGIPEHARVPAAGADGRRTGGGRADRGNISPLGAQFSSTGAYF
ncbi:hypothetical protein B0T19DRAFT_178835 [Cercophora scortea]|uniref:Uncharacterized protein n=1 Tax=Cercophora scortea TaxID=314031 RepID=A0AAE0MDR3_9PEZI|nr:hypothetical protein B0T19DRAFT_178835 [Cercophora scortea]